MATSPMITTLVGQSQQLDIPTKLKLTVETVGLHNGELPTNKTAQDVINERKAQPYDGLEMKAATVIEHPDQDRLHRESCRYFMYHLFRGHRNREWRDRNVFDDDEEIVEPINTISESNLPTNTRQQNEKEHAFTINETEMVDMIG